MPQTVQMSGNCDKDILQLLKKACPLDAVEVVTLADMHTPAIRGAVFARICAEAPNFRKVAA